MNYDKNELTERQRKEKISKLVDKCMDVFDGHEVGVVLEALEKLDEAVQMCALISVDKEG